MAGAILLIIMISHDVDDDDEDIQDAHDDLAA